uniref:Uncharacterized protein n=1 Tax=Panstrongylus lignarius TaxID=156445 RepID=A0A224XVP3_9HEMI
MIISDLFLAVRPVSLSIEPTWLLGTGLLGLFPPDTERIHVCLYFHGYLGVDLAAPVTILSICFCTYLRHLFLIWQQLAEVPARTRVLA